MSSSKISPELPLETFHEINKFPLTDIQTLSLSSLGVYDNSNEPGSSLAHLYELIRPSLTTLVKLRIDNLSDEHRNDFDLQILKPSADTLRSFEYTLQSVDEGILDTIPTILPYLTKLSIKWEKYVFVMMHSILWKACFKKICFPLNDINDFLQDAHIQVLSKNVNLTHLELSSNFEEASSKTGCHWVEITYSV